MVYKYIREGAERQNIFLLLLICTIHAVSIIMYACVCGKKPFLAGGNPFRPAINTVIRLDLPYNPHLIRDTQLLIYDIYLKHCQRHYGPTC